MGLHYGILGVNVNDKAWKIVSLAMHKTVGVVVCHTGHADAFAHIECGLQSSLPKLHVYAFLLKRQYAHRNAANLPMTFGNEVTFRGVDVYNVTFLGIAVNMMYGTGENPRVKALKALLLASLQI